MDEIVGTRTLTPVWQRISGILDSYLGVVPESFVYNNKTYTPQSFAAYLGLNQDDYISLYFIHTSSFLSTFRHRGPRQLALGTIV